MLNATAVIAFLFAIAGLLQLSNATLGVGLLAFACFIGILVRIIQAEAHQRALGKFLMSGGAKEIRV